MANEKILSAADAERARCVAVCKSQVEMLEAAGAHEQAEGARLCANVLGLLSPAAAADLSKILRARCPKDDGSAAHLAVDVRLPLAMSATGVVLSALGRCPCGEGMVLKYDNTPPIGGAT
jgi:hypothetical protein